MSNQNSRVKCVEVSERELDGVVERAQFAQKQEIAQEAYSESRFEGPVDVKLGLASLCRKYEKELEEYLSKHDYELRYGPQSQPK